MPARHVGVADTTLRSLVHLFPQNHASIGRLIPVVERLDRAGFHAIDVWGDLPFEHSLTLLNESPWERLRALCARMPATRRQMALRSTSLMGSRPWPRYMVEEFVKQAVDCGVQSFLAHDPLNGGANLEVVASAVRAAGAGLHLAVVHGSDPQGAIEETVATCCRVMALEPDALCLKTGSALGPSSAVAIVKALRTVCPCSLEVDLDNAAGLAAFSSALCIDGGADVVYASAAPALLDSSAVPLVTVLDVLGDLGIPFQVDADLAGEAADAFAALAAARGDLDILDSASARPGHQELKQVPAAVALQLAARLRELGALERLQEVLRETIKVRREMGLPALVPPLAQVAATQAVLNVLYGRRWQVVSDEMRSYLRGSYGRPPAEPPEEVMLMALGNKDERASSSPDFPESMEALQGSLGATEPEEDAILLALAPDDAAAFLQRRRAGRRVEVGTGIGVTEQPAASWQDDWADLGPDKVRDLVALLEGSSVDELTIENKGTRVSLRKADHPAAQSVDRAAAGAPQTPVPEPVALPTLPGASRAASGLEGTRGQVVATMVATFYRGPSPEAPPFVVVGQHVNPGDVLCILEAMKLMNELVAEVPGVITSVLVEDGTAVEYGQPLFMVEPDSE